MWVDWMGSPRPRVYDNGLEYSKVVMKAFCGAGIELIASARTGNTLPYVRCRYHPPLQEVGDHEFYIIHERP